MTRNQGFKSFITVGMVAFFSLSALPLGKLRGYDVGAIILVLSALLCVWRPPQGSFGLKRADRWLLAAGLLYVVAGVVEIWLDQQPLRGYDHVSRFVLTLPIFLALVAYPPRPQPFFVAAAVGGLLLGGASIYTKIILGQSNGAMGLLSIQYACISMVIAAIALAGTGYFYHGRRLALCGLCFVGSIMGAVAVFLSTSRGSWLSIGVMLLLMLWVYRRQLNVKMLALGAVLVGGLGLGLYLTPQTNVQARVAQAISDIDRWQDKDRHSSLGDRFVMWDNALDMGQQKWFLGWGAQGYAAEIKRLVGEGTLVEAFLRYGHPHNELLNAWVKRGIPGVLALLLLYAVPMVTFGRYLRQTHSVATRSVALACMSLPLCFLIAGLTQTLFAHNSGVMFYIVALVLCWGVLRGVVATPATTAASGR